MNRIQSFLVFWAILGSVISPSVSMGQGQGEVRPNAPSEPPADRRKADTVTKMIPVKHAVAQELAAVLAQVYRGEVSVAVDDRTNSIIVSTGAGTLSRVEATVKELDSEGDLKRKAMEVRHYNIEPARRAGAENGALIETARRLTGRDGFVSIIGSTMTVNSTPPEHDAIRLLVENLAKPAPVKPSDRGITIYCYFLQSVRGDGARSERPPIPDGLRPAVAALAENGVGGVELLSAVTVHATMNNRTYEVWGTLDDSTCVLICGTATPGPNDDMAEVQINAQLKGVERGKGESGTIPFQLKTSVAARFGEYIVLAAAPSRNSQRDSMAMVIRVVANN